MKSLKKIILERVRRIGLKYRNRPRHFLMSLCSWSFKQMLKAPAKCTDDGGFELEVSRLDSSDGIYRLENPGRLDVPRTDILVYANGGIGDIVMLSTFLKELFKYAGSDIVFTVVSGQNRDALRSVFLGYAFVGRVASSEEINIDAFDKDWDAVLSAGRFLSVQFMNEESLCAKAPVLYDYLCACRDFERKNAKFFEQTSSMDTLSVIYSILNGKKRYSQTDFNGALGINAGTMAFTTLDPRGGGILARNGLDQCVYMTFQRGVDALYKGKVSTRLWPSEHYSELVRMLKAEFPSLRLVQLGRKNPESDLEGMDLDLRGKTTFEELKTVLKHSALHLDADCGMVHLAHNVQGKSAVLFGPTNPDFLGYPENINLRAQNVCSLWCEWVTDDWQQECLRGAAIPLCMRELAPVMVMDGIRNHLAEMVSRPGYVLGRIHREAKPIPGSWNGRGDGAGKKTIVFAGDFNSETVETCAARNDVEKVFHFSTAWTADHWRDVKSDRLADGRGDKIIEEYGDVLNLPLRSGSVDEIWTDAREPSPPLLFETVRLLKPGGLMACSDGFYEKKATASG